MPEKITILKDGGESINSNIVSIFMIPESGKRYIITTENAVDPHGLTVLHVSEIQGTNLVKIETDEEWSLIKTVMRAIISSSVGSYQYIPSFSQATASGQYSRDISVSEPASKQMIDSYANGEKIDPDAAVAEPVVEQNVDSIFPTAPVTQNDNEVVPGIAVEEAAPVTIEATPASVDENATPAVQPVIQPAPTPEVVPAPVVAQPEVDAIQQPAILDAAVPLAPEQAVEVSPVIGNTAVPVSEAALVSETIPEQAAPVQAPDTAVAEPVIQDSVTSVSNSAPEQGQPILETPVTELDSLNATIPQAPVAVPAQDAASIGDAIVNPILNTAVPNISAVPSEMQQLANMPINNVGMPIPNISNQVPQQAPEMMTNPVEMMTPDALPTIPVIDSGMAGNQGANVVVDNNMQQLSVPQSVMANQQPVQQAGPTPLQKLGININFDAQPDLSSKATLDEVVAGAQELFQEGVKNLVMVMTERIYKDLKAKEEDLKRREIIVAQREQAINDQTMNMMSSGYNQTMVRQPMMQQQMYQQPMMQQQMYQQPMMQQQMYQQPVMQQVPGQVPQPAQPMAVHVPNDNQ